MSYDFLSSAVSIAPTMTAGPNTDGLEEGGITQMGESCKQATTIDMLPDDVVLHIFYFCRKDHDPFAWHPPRHVWKWRRLTQVCQRWRQIIFASPRHLDIQIYCTYGTHVREVLRCWPTFPIAIDYSIYYADNSSKPGVITPPTENWNDVMVALEHLDRVCSIRMSITDILLEKLAVVLQRPCPWLASLTLHSAYYYTLALQSVHSYTRALPLPDSFLVGCAPRLQKLVLNAIPFPTFPRFLRSARDLVELRLNHIPLIHWSIRGRIWSISAGMMVAGLAALTKLECLHISFQPSLGLQISHPDQILAIPSTRIVLPALTRFLFTGTREYLEEFVAQIETPQLTDLTITLSAPDCVVRVPELFQFIGRTEHLKLAKFRRARTRFSESDPHISLDRSQAENHPCHLDLKLNCYRPSMTPIQLLTQLLSQSFLIISNVRDLSINPCELLVQPRSNQIDNADLSEWLAFLRPFTAVETLLTCDPLAELLGPVIGDLTVFPALQSLDRVPWQSLNKLCEFPIS